MSETKSVTESEMRQIFADVPVPTEEELQAGVRPLKKHKDEYDAIAKTYVKYLNSQPRNSNGTIQVYAPDFAPGLTAVDPRNWIGQFEALLDEAVLVKCGYRRNELVIDGNYRISVYNDNVNILLRGIVKGIGYPPDHRVIKIITHDQYQLFVKLHRKTDQVVEVVLITNEKKILKFTASEWTLKFIEVPHRLPLWGWSIPRMDGGYTTYMDKYSWKRAVDVIFAEKNDLWDSQLTSISTF